MPLDHALAVCLAELRSSTRRARTFVFGAVAAAGVVATVAIASQAASQVLPLAGSYAPRFVLSVAGNVWLWLFAVATVFLAFDSRQQDERVRVAEVLDARPVSNLALLGGRWAAAVLVAWLALVVVAALIQAVGSMSRMIFDASGSETATLAWWLGVTVEPVSLVMLMTVDAVPALALVAAVVVLLATALRRRALTITVALALVGLHVYAVAKAPMYLMPAVSLVTSYADFASDVAPTYADSATLVQRAVVLCFAVALVIAAASLHPRDDGGSRTRRAAAAILLAVVGCIGIVGVVVHAAGELALRERWLATHEAARDLAFPDVRHVAGEVRIVPGKHLTADVELKVAAPADTTLERLRFSLNPGLAVGTVEVAGLPASSTHRDGILTVELPEALAPMAETSLTLRARGVPDERFAYLDSAVDWRRLPAANRLLLLGTDGSAFSTKYVGLMPGIAWLPTSGPNLAHRPQDAFTADLTVHVPESWLVAGPGRRETVSPGVFRFRPATPLPELGLFAARFERRAVEVRGVLLEILVVPEHAGQLDSLAEVMAGDVGIVARVGEMLDEARDAGLAYPFAGFSMVEVPARLRRYGSGTHMDTTLFPPALALVPEYGFPTRFERTFLDRRMAFGISPRLGNERADRQQGMLWRLFNHEAAAGRLHHVARNAFAVRAQADGSALALDALCRVLAARVVWRLYATDSALLFTAHRFANPSPGDANPLRLLVWGGGPSRVRAAADRPSVWEAAERTALADLDQLTDQALAMDVLTLRIDRAAQAIQDRYGLEKAGSVLVELRRRLADSAFSAEDFAASSAAMEVDVEALLGDWLGATAMPGFRMSDVEAFRLRDGEDGRPRYQVLVDVRNSEPTPGLIQVTYASAPGSGRSVHAEPIPIAGDAAVRIGEVLVQPPQALWIRSYLSRNREDVHLAVGTVDAAKVVDDDAFVGARPSDWRPREHGIIVDDVDEGFAVESAGDAGRLGGGQVVADQVETDAGLPVHGGVRSEVWARQSLPTAWGRYRRTAVRIGVGRGANRATFDADLPEAGRWRLAYHVPDLEKVGMYRRMSSSRDEQGVHAIEVVSGESVATVDFDAAAATPGWNEIDVFELGAGRVRVAVSDATSGRTVVADAIRWERRPR